jgi:hypothetical protein
MECKKSARQGTVIVPIPAVERAYAVSALATIAPMENFLRAILLRVCKKLMTGRLKIFSE